MIISQTPFRISFFGGGTDYPMWFKEHGGAVLSTTINKYAYISCRHLPPFFEHKHRIVYSLVECVREAAEIQHPVIRVVLQKMAFNEGLEIHYDGDLPARSGLGSSSTFTVGLLNSLQAIRGFRLGREELALEAIEVEQDLLREAVGCQDQVAASYGGFNRINFHRDGKFTVIPVVIEPTKLELLNERLLLFYTGVPRYSSEIAASQLRNFHDREAELRQMAAYVDDAQNLLQSRTGSLHDFGKLMHENWQLKRQLSDLVSNSLIDETYRAARAAGALGGKVLGAGGGGFMLFYVPEQAQAAVRSRLRKLIEVDYRFETGGSQIIVYHPEKAIFRRSREIGVSA